MAEKMYKCPNCSKTYKKNGSWLRKHMIEKCHVMYLKPVVITIGVDLQDILLRIINLERIFNGPAAGNFHDISIERIKKEEAEKIIDPVLAGYRSAFAECVSEFQEVLGIKKKRLELIELELAN